jgi:hypothetical protein
MFGDGIVELKNVSEEGWKVILELRREKQWQMERAMQIATCKHEFSYAGHGHNDDAYKCSKCGEIEWR